VRKKDNDNAMMFVYYKFRRCRLSCHSQKPS